MAAMDWKAQKSVLTSGWFPLKKNVELRLTPTFHKRLDLEQFQWTKWLMARNEKVATENWKEPSCRDVRESLQVLSIMLFDIFVFVPRLKVSMLWTRELTRGGPGVNGRFALAHAEWAFRIKKDNVNQSECVKMGDLSQLNPFQSQYWSALIFSLLSELKTYAEERGEYKNWSSSWNFWLTTCLSQWR